MTTLLTVKDIFNHYAGKVYKERERQMVLWGSEDLLLKNRGFERYLFDKIVVLGEEYGEICKAALEHGTCDCHFDTDELETELIQVAAVCMAILEGIYINGAIHENQES